MDKREILQNMAIDRMMDNIAYMAGDVSQLKLDVVTIQNDIAELRKMIKERKERRKQNGASNKTDKGTQD